MSEPQEALPPQLPVMWAGHQDKLVGRIQLIPNMMDRLIFGELFTMSGMVIDRRIIGVDVSRINAFPPPPAGLSPVKYAYPDQLPVTQDWDPINYIGLIKLDDKTIRFLEDGLQLTFSASVLERTRLVAVNLSVEPATPRR